MTRYVVVNAYADGVWQWVEKGGQTGLTRQDTRRSYGIGCRGSKAANSKSKGIV
jgi:hypothetical protein